VGATQAWELQAGVFWVWASSEGNCRRVRTRGFKRKVQQEDIIKEVRRHSFYLKPGEKKRVKEALARKRARKKSRKESD
jgi:small subunit ribosomal protein S21